MQTVSWLTQGLELTDFAVFASQDPGYMSSSCMGRLNGQEVHVALPISFQTLHDQVWVSQILETTRRERMDKLGEKIIILALGESIGRRVMENRNYLSNLSI